MASYKLTGIHLYRLTCHQDPNSCLPSVENNVSNSIFLSMAAFSFSFVSEFMQTLFPTQNAFPHLVLLEIPTHCEHTA